MSMHNIEHEQQTLYAPHENHLIRFLTYCMICCIASPSEPSNHSNCITIPDMPFCTLTRQHTRHSPVREISSVTVTTLAEDVVAVLSLSMISTLHVPWLFDSVRSESAKRSASHSVTAHSSRCSDVSITSSANFCRFTVLSITSSRCRFADDFGTLPEGFCRVAAVLPTSSLRLWQFASDSVTGRSATDDGEVRPFESKLTNDAPIVRNLSFSSDICCV